VPLVFIGNGNLMMAKDFAEQFGITAPLYTDPSKASYSALGMSRKFGVMKSLVRGARATAGGFRQGKTAGDPFQQGGVVLFAKGGDILWSHIDSGAGHASDIDAFRQAVAAIA
jgi:hypothetical protein